MPEIINLILVFLVGIVASFFSSTVGGSAMISIPALIFLGLPPQIAIATDRLGGFGSQATSLFKFWKADKIVWKYIPLLAVVSVIGSVIGANILLSVNPEILQKLTGFLLLVFLPFVIFNKNIGVQHTETSKFKKTIGYIVYFFLQIFNSFFGVGTGPFFFYTLVIAFGLSMIEASATRIIPLIIMAISSVIVFALHGIIDYKVGIILLLGMAIGGYIGAHVALKKGNAWVKGLFAIMVTVAGIKLLFF